MRLYAEARRRGIFRVAATYLVVSWLVLEVGHLLSLILELPHVVMRVVLGALVLGFPLALGLAWYFRIATGSWDPHIDLPESEPASNAENAGHEHGKHGGGHGGGHGGHGAHGGGGVDPLPIIMGVLTLGALLVLGVNRIVGTDDGGGGEGHGAKTENVVHRGTTAPEALAAAPARVAPANSIAVLPFDNMSGDPGQAFFSDGLAEEVRSALAGVAGLQVAARTSSDAFRGTKTDIGTIGAKLGVAYTLEGSVRRSGDVVRVSAQLIEASTGFERWSQTYDRRVKDVFAIQSEIATRVTDALKVQLLPQETARLAESATTSATAHDAFLRGRALYRQSGGEAVYRSALAQFDAAIAADPEYAMPYSARAATLAFLAGQFVDNPADAHRLNVEALASARTAARLAPDVPYVQAMLGYVLDLGALDFAGASAAFDRSMVGGSGDADVLGRYGEFNARNGDVAKGIAALEKAVRLDPVNARAWKSFGNALFFARRYPEAVERQREALRLNPDFVSGHMELGNMLLLQGRLDEARAAYNAEPARWAKLVGLAIIERRQGNKAAADAAWQALTSEFPDSTLYQQVQVLAQWGDKAGALARLERAFTVVDPGLVYLRRDPMIDVLRDDPRFKVLAARLEHGGAPAA